MTKKAAKPKKLDDFKRTKPCQMTLFEMVLPEDKKYSNTIKKRLEVLIDNDLRNDTITTIEKVRLIFK